MYVHIGLASVWSRTFVSEMQTIGSQELRSLANSSPFFLYTKLYEI